MQEALGQPALARLPLDELVRTRLYPQLQFFFDKLSAEGAELRLDGVAALRSDDKFLPGKIALGLGHVLLDTPREDPRLPGYLARYRAVAELTAGHDNHSWGIYYYLLILVRLREAGLLDEAIGAATLQQLREKLDWRRFVEPGELRLIDLPTNYYGVAFSVARLRELLGWESGEPAARLLQKMLEHYERYSGGFGFSDETAGEGRFDRYSVLLIAEVCQRFVQTGLAVPPRLLGLLRQSAQLVLGIANPMGHGFGFGRSIGPYGDSAVVEILSVAAHLGVLDDEEKRRAYAYSACCLARYLAFWFNPRIHSVDMWGQGRRTDRYRAKHRILGENFSLIHQYISSNSLWNQAGFRGQVPEPGLGDWLRRTRPPLALTWFAKGEYERALLVRRDGDDVFCLPLVNGGNGQHENSPYYPIPFAEGLVAGIADSGCEHPQLLPRFVLDDGSVLLPTSFMRGVACGSAGDHHWLEFHQEALNCTGGVLPQPDARLRLHTRYEFAPGCITRIDCVQPAAPLRLAELSLDFLSFSSAARADGATAVNFDAGRVQRFELEGLPLQQLRPTQHDDDFKSPSGPMKTWLRYSAQNLDLAGPLTLRWTLRYR